EPAQLGPPVRHHCAPSRHLAHARGRAGARSRRPTVGRPKSCGRRAPCPFSPFGAGFFSSGIFSPLGALGCLSSFFSSAFSSFFSSTFSRGLINSTFLVTTGVFESRWCRQTTWPSWLARKMRSLQGLLTGNFPSI